MTDNHNFLDDKDVVYFLSDRFDFDPTMKVEQIKQKITQWVNQHFKRGKQLFPFFIDKCEILKQDSNGWKKGKIRIRFEFIPDEDETEPVKKFNQYNKGTLDEFRS